MLHFCTFAASSASPLAGAAWAVEASGATTGEDAVASGVGSTVVGVGSAVVRVASAVVTVVVAEEDHGILDLGRRRRSSSPV